MTSVKMQLHLQKLAALKKGTHHSQETKNKIAASRIGKKGALSNSWKGGEIKHFRKGDFYIYTYSPTHPYASKSGYIMEHRLIIEAHLGRYLKPKEVVHHINGKRHDNRIENLIVFPSAGKHTATCHLKFDNRGKFASH